MIDLLLAAALLTQFQDYPGVVELPGVTVRGVPLDYRLLVDLAGADAPSALVVSADPAMNCGDSRFNASPGPFRKCWLRGQRGEPIQLVAQHDGIFGQDWTIDWTGCQPQGDGRSCTAAIASEMHIGATFRRL